MDRLSSAGGLVDRRPWRLIGQIGQQVVPRQLPTEHHLACLPLTSAMAAAFTVCAVRRFQNAELDADIALIAGALCRRRGKPRQPLADRP